MIKCYRDLLITYFYFDPFKMPCVYYDIRLELVNKISVFNWFSSIFGSLSGHHQRRCILQIFNIAFHLRRCNFF